MDFLNPLIIVDSNKYGLNSVSLFFLIPLCFHALTVMPGRDLLQGVDSLGQHHL